MITFVESDLSTFRRLAFHSGLNLLIADKTEDSLVTDTRNGVGKSSLLEIIHFLLGGNAGPGSIFRNIELEKYSFVLGLLDVRDEAGAAEIRVSRSGESPTEVRISDREGDTWGVPRVQTNGQWKSEVSLKLFGLSEDSGLSARTLVSYFVRRFDDGAMQDPFRIDENQSTGSVQSHISYLLGFDWSIPVAWEAVRTREKGLATLRRALKRGDLGPGLTDAGELRAELIRTELRANRHRQELLNFEVIEQYREMEAEASSITLVLRDLSDQSYLDLQYLEDLQSAIASEQPPDLGDVAAVFEEVGVVLPEIALRRFDEVKAFHESVVRNRVAYLQSEVSRTAANIDRRSTEAVGLQERRSDLMRILRAGGALESYAELQSDLAKLDGRAEVLRERYSQAQALESERTELTHERQSLLEQLQRDHRERDSQVVEAITTFAGLSEELYGGDGGNLVIEETLNGPTFDVRIPGERSRGITNMQIFCLDVTLMRLGFRAGRTPGFLIHDSHLFDGVDARQIATALRVAADSADEYGYQHIVSLNSDILEPVSAIFDSASYELPVRLTDATDAGGLFGLRFA